MVESDEDFGELSLGDMQMVPYIKLVDPETGKNKAVEDFGKYA